MKVLRPPVGNEIDPTVDQSQFKPGAVLENLAPTSIEFYVRLGVGEAVEAPAEPPAGEPDPPASASRKGRART